MCNKSAIFELQTQCLTWNFIWTDQPKYKIEFLLKRNIFYFLNLKFGATDSIFYMKDHLDCPTKLQNIIFILNFLYEFTWLSSLLLWVYLYKTYRYNLMRIIWPYFRINEFTNLKISYKYLRTWYLYLLKYMLMLSSFII